MDAELLINDLIAVERKLERLAEERKKGGGREKAVIEREIVLFERFKEALGNEQPLREVEISAEDEKSLSGFGFLTRKPLLTLLNLGEGQALPPVDDPRPHTALVPLQGKLEMELAQLAPEDAQVFMEEYGIQSWASAGSSASPMSCWGCSPSSPSARTRCAPGRCAAAPAPSRPPVRSTPTCRRASSAPRWWLTMSWSPWAG